MYWALNGFLALTQLAHWHTNSFLLSLQNMNNTSNVDSNLIVPIISSNYYLRYQTFLCDCAFFNQIQINSMHTLVIIYNSLCMYLWGMGVYSQWGYHCSKYAGGKLGHVLIS